jgi:hypothetical protein|tara:strand:- start:31 stop:846 length:816 start_codon:yes stop_codon:yes gene_type:complete
MRNILTIIIATLISFSAMAKEINVVISGKAGGSSYSRSIMLGDWLKSQGYQVNMIKSMNAKKGYAWFNKSEVPTIIALTDATYAEVSKKKLKAKNVGVIEFENYLHLCGKILGDAKVSWRSDYPEGYDKVLSKALGVKIIPIPYDRSSAEIEALLAKDIDMSLFNTKNAIKVKAKGITCPYYTGSTPDKNVGAEPLTTLTKDPKATLSFTYFTMIKNIEDVGELRELLGRQIEDNDYASFVEGRKADYIGDRVRSQKELGKYLNTQIKNWR